MERRFLADRGDAGHRIDRVLLRRLADVPGLSRTRVQAWVEAGHVRVDGALVRKPSARVPPGATVVVTAMVGARERRVPEPEAVPLTVLFEDDYLLVVDKPAGLVVHPSYKHPDGTLFNALLWHARAWPPGARPGLVQRLDRDTSGVLLVAKTRAVHAALQRAMYAGRVEKRYLAVVHGRPTPLRGRIDEPLGRDLGDRRRVVTAATGRPSVTFYERLAASGRGARSVSLVECRLGTGRMHQIRVHFASRGWPIVGDAAYGLRPADATSTGHPTLARHALHAWRLAFPHPVTGATLSLESRVPDDLRRLLGSVGLDEAAIEHRAVRLDGSAAPRSR